MPSQVTIELQRLLEARDAKGLAKYGVTLDRVDLNAVEWIDHTIQELLDAAGYLMSLRREIIARNDELQELDRPE